MLRHGVGIPASGRSSGRNRWQTGLTPGKCSGTAQEYPHPAEAPSQNAEFCDKQITFHRADAFRQMPHILSVTSVPCTGTARLKRFPRPAGSHTDCLSRYCITFSARRQVFFRIRQTRSFFQSRGGPQIPSSASARTSHAPPCQLSSARPRCHIIRILRNRPRAQRSSTTVTPASPSP